MWLALVLASSFVVSLRDSFKKSALSNNDTLNVLMLTTVFICLFFLPCLFFTENASLEQHMASGVKSIMMCACWICSYIGFKNLPLTMASLISTLGPVFVLIGAVLIFSEHLSALQLIGIIVAFCAMISLNVSGKKEGIQFKSNKYVWIMLLSSIISAAAALYDKLLFAPKESGGYGMGVIMVQTLYNYYLCLILVIIFLLRKSTGKTEKIKFKWTIIAVALAECGSDLLFCAALTDENAMISVLSMICRGGYIIVSFITGIVIFKEKNIKSKLRDLTIILIGMLLIALGSI